MNGKTKADCLFCRIAQRKVPAHIVHEDERVLAFLDRGPIRPGHTQIVPKEHFAYFDEAPADVLTATLAVGQKLARVMKRTFKVPRVAFLLTGGDIAHVHAHLVPIHDKTDITSRRYIVEENLTFRSLPPANDEELARITSDLRRALAPHGDGAKPAVATASARPRRIKIDPGPAETAGPA
jgi:histidine triad (HIT) family protein